MGWVELRDVAKEYAVKVVLPEDFGVLFFFFAFWS